MGPAVISVSGIMIPDEPGMDLSPIPVSEIFETIRVIDKEGMTILPVEQNAGKALSIEDREYVLITGRIVSSGAADDLIHNDSIRKADPGES